MPGPFPGMDPWLEAPDLWKGFHDTMVVKTKEVLQPDLNQRGYYVELGERVWVVEDEQNIWPDDLVFRRLPTRETSAAPNAAVADEPIRVARPGEEMSESFLQIRTAVSHELVACIEFVSHSNKQSGRGRESYQEKQRELDNGNVHLVEIDLLRSGQHVVAVPEWVVARCKPWDYLINVGRRESDVYEFYPVALRRRLPRVAVPLKTGDADAVLDVQEVVDRSYDISAYAMWLPYEQAPIPPLNSEDAAWADGILKQAGLRK